MPIVKNKKKPAIKRAGRLDVFNTNGRAAGAAKIYNTSPIESKYFPTYDKTQRMWGLNRRGKGLETMIYFCGAMAALGWKPGDVVPHIDFVKQVWSVLQRRKDGEIGDRALGTEIDRINSLDWTALKTFAVRPDQPWEPELVPGFLSQKAAPANAAGTDSDTA